MFSHEIGLTFLDEYFVSFLLYSFKYSFSCISQLYADVFHIYSSNSIISQFLNIKFKNSWDMVHLSFKTK